MVSKSIPSALILRGKSNPTASGLVIVIGTRIPLGIISIL
jgi:hypothetical protein